jgi:hypothetical protein
VVGWIGVPRAQFDIFLSQLMDFTLLASDFQIGVFDSKAVDGVEPQAERTLRTVAHAGTWAKQRAAWKSISIRAAPASPST